MTKNTEFDHQCTAGQQCPDCELKAVTEFAYKKWADNEGYKLHYTDTNLLYCYTDKDDKALLLPTIDHPFMHELIKGLYLYHLTSFIQWLNEICAKENNATSQLDVVVSGNVTVHKDGLKVMLTASVPNLLRAFYRSAAQPEKTTETLPNKQ